MAKIGASNDGPRTGAEVTPQPPPEQQVDEPAPTIVLGPQTRITFMGVTIIGLLVGLCIGAWSASAAFTQINTTIGDKVSKQDLTRWTRDAKVQYPQLPIWLPDDGAAYRSPTYQPPKDDR
jgi:hypothetical protein